ncbi:MAG: SUMF1/EgtB/PvdO family nonheme iron enzyme [Chloroflexi bacterium]|nr:SUMF1/EgtB/PvdO family nonheme iron enzyme [Chloroflexota bacterium]
MTEQYIFISYAHNDVLIAEKVERYLIKNGFRVFRDATNIHSDDAWTQKINIALNQTDRMVLLLSNHSMPDRREVENEWAFFQRKNKPIHLLYIEECEIHYRLAIGHYIDAKLNLATALRQLVIDLKNIPPYQPPNPDQIKTYSDEIRKIIGEPFDFCPIPPGEYLLGQPENSANANGRRGNLVSVDGFYMAKYPITSAQFQRFYQVSDGFKDRRWREDLAATPDHYLRLQDHAFPINRHPCNTISWFDAIAFCRWLSYRLKGSHRLENIVEWKIRLPTDAEWEAAARGFEGFLYPWGDEFCSNFCNTLENSIEGPTPVDQFPDGASPFGVMDMCGNVWEWTFSNWTAPLANLTVDKIDLRNDQNRVAKGGSWGSSATTALASNRVPKTPMFRNPNHGFRIVAGS